MTPTVQFIIDNSIAMLTVIVGGLFGLAYKTYIRKVNVIDSRLSTHDSEIRNVDHRVVMLETNHSNLTSRLDRIEDKLDRLLTLLAKNYPND